MSCVIYRVSQRAGRDEPNCGEHIGYHYTTRMREANRLQRASNRASWHKDTITVVPVNGRSLAEIARILNRYGSHPDNG